MKCYFHANISDILNWYYNYMPIVIQQFYCCYNSLGVIRVWAGTKKLALVLFW
jgi:hypothetical protein